MSHEFPNLQIVDKPADQFRQAVRFVVNNVLHLDNSFSISSESLNYLIVSGTVLTELN